MARNLQKIQQMKEMLETRSPVLKSIQFQTAHQARRSDSDLSDFIEGIWGDYYQNTPRIQFTQDAFQFFGPKDHTHDMHVVAMIDGQIIGTFLSFPYNLQIDDKTFKGTTVTGLTTSPEFRGQKISQYLVLTMEECLIINNYDLLTFWLDNRKNQSGSSYNIYSSNRMRT